jgi:hypothetical protein
MLLDFFIYFNDNDDDQPEVSLLFAIGCSTYLT